MTRLRKGSRTWLRFFFSIIFPTLLAIAFSVGAIYMVIVPAFERTFLDGKKEMIRQLTNVAWSILELYQREEDAGRLSQQEAQARALLALEFLRYGEKNRDYFWVTDDSPTMVMHPYSSELVGVDLSSFEDVQGKRIFQEIKNTVSQQESGFIDYSWNKKYAEELTVPKLSYVKRFPPWQWVVGTGVYLDDVERKTVEITRHLSRLSLAAVLLIALLLVYVGRQSYVIERRRKTAEIELKNSRQKYKKLVETATDPILMFFNQRCIYSNRPVWSLLQYSKEELGRIDLIDLIVSDHSLIEHNEKLPSEQIDYFQEGRYEVKLRPKTGDCITALLNVSKIDLDDREATVINIKDISGAKKVAKELDESQEKYRLLTSWLNIGVFRVQAEKHLRFIEANPAALNLLDIDGEVEGVELQDVLKDNKVNLDIYALVLQDGFIRNKTLNLKNKKRSISISLSIVLTRDDKGRPLYCDGRIEDISERSRKEKERENLIVELQTSLLFLNQPLSYVLGEFIDCDATVPISEAAQLMSTKQSSSLLVKNQTGAVDGILTDMALREKVVATRLDYDTPVADIMSSPLIFIDDSALIFEASMLMEERGVKHLVVKDSRGEVASVISNEDLLNVHRYSSTFLINEIADAQSVGEVSSCCERLPRIIKALVDSGAHARNITRIITTVSDTVLGKFIDFAVEEMGEPPVRFAFISLGSEGREEQTLATDQDNAIIFEDVPEEEGDRVSSYFLAFSEKVCTWLDQAGYDFCKGNVMAMNPDWCQPISKWKEYFNSWITEAKPKDLMEVSIFFDFRCLYGDVRFIHELRADIAMRVANRDAFFYQLAQNALLFRLPLDFFGNISVESSGDNPDTFNIKHVIALVVGYARIYAINFAFDETNTLQRLDLLRERDFIGKNTHEEISEAYNYLMQVRFKHQVTMMNRGLKPDNHIRLDELNYMEKSVLKKIFSQVGSLQKQLHAIGKVEIFF